LQVSYFGIAESLGINQLSSAYKVFDFDMNLFLNSKKKNGTRSAGIRHVELDRRCALAEIYTHTHTRGLFIFSYTQQRIYSLAGPEPLQGCLT
jgi:hypothetical protein